MTDFMLVFVSVYVSVNMKKVQKAVSPRQFKKKKNKGCPGNILYTIMSLRKRNP